MARYTLNLFSKSDGNYLIVMGRIMHKQYMANMRKCVALDKNYV